MHNRELVTRVARRTSLTQKQVREVLEAVVDITTEALVNGEPVTLTGLGRFELREYKGRRVRHPQTRQPCDTQSRRLPAFHPYPLLKRRVRAGKRKEEHEM